jgi:UDP-GlcNAc:undecaprenyl-phosphate GlcNAc-1-phosphate transferase
MAYTGSSSILLLLDAYQGIFAQFHAVVRWNFLLPASLVFLIGLLDDLLTLRPSEKIAAEIFAAFLAYIGGIQIHDFLWYPVPSYLGLPLTVLWLVGCTNAFNLIDGLDGLATGIGLLATLTTLGAGLLQGNVGLITATTPLAGALLGFLIFNFNPASIFLGDGGSLWVGFMLACFGVMWCEKSVTVMSITAPMMALAIPLLDTALSIARRYLRRQPIFTADRGHIHHRLIDRGLSPRRTALLLYAAGSVGACFSLLQSAGSPITRGLSVVVFCILVWFGIRYLGYREFALAANLLRHNTLRSLLRSSYSLQGYEELLRAADNTDECWRVIRAIAREFTFAHVELRLCGRTYKEDFAKTTGEKWALQIPLSRSDFVTLGCQVGVSTREPAVAQVADLLHGCLSVKTAAFLLRVPAANAATQPGDLDVNPLPADASLPANA